MTMYGLPEATELRKRLPKAQLYRKYNWDNARREHFDADISRLDIVNAILPRTMPGIAAGENVKSIYVVEVSLKRADCDPRNIELLARAIPQHIVYALRHGEEVRFAVCHERLFMTDWQPLIPNSTFLTPNSELIPNSTFLTPNSELIPNSTFLTPKGLSLDAVWQNYVTSIGGFEVEENNTLTEQIHVNAERDAIRRQIAALRQLMRNERQPRRRRELYNHIRTLEKL